MHRGPHDLDDVEFRVLLKLRALSGLLVSSGPIHRECGSIWAATGSRVGVAKFELPVRREGVQAPVLEQVRVELVVQADSPAFLAQVEDDAPRPP